MADKKEIDEIVNFLKKKKSKFLLFQCTSDYPATNDMANMRVLNYYKKFKVPLGYSDHTKGNVSAIGSIFLGCKVVEKHFTLDKNLPGPDHWFSSDFDEFKELVNQIRIAEKRMGNIKLKPAVSEIKVRKMWQLGLVWNKDMSKGSKIKTKDIVIRKPATGLKPKNLASIIGKKVVRNCKKNKPLLVADYMNK